MDDWKQLHRKLEQGIKDEEVMGTVQIGKDRTEGISAWDIVKKCVYISLYSLGQEPRLLILTALPLSVNMYDTLQQCFPPPPGASPCRALYVLLLFATTVVQVTYTADIKSSHGGWWPDREPVESHIMKLLLLFSLLFLKARKLYPQSSHTEI